MKPYFTNGRIQLYHGRAEELLPRLSVHGFGCLLLDPPVSMRTAEDCDSLFDLLDCAPLLEPGALVYTLANPRSGIFTIVMGAGGERSKTMFSPFRNSQPVEAFGHPHSRPLATMKSLLQSTAGRILDPYAGSGTTLLAAHELGREAVGIEIEEKYCAQIAKRLSA